MQESDAADLVQEVLSLLVTKLPHFVYDPTKSFRSWLRTVMRNKYHESRRPARVPVQSLGDAQLDDLAAPDDVADLAEAEFQRHLAYRALELMRTEFQPTTWKACWEQVVAARSAEDVAAELKLTVNAAYLAKCRVLRRLHRELHGLLD